MIDKIYELDVDYSNAYGIIETNVAFKEGDLNSSYLRCNLVDDEDAIDITDYSISIVSVNEKYERVVTDMVKVLDGQLGKIEIEFKSNQLLEGENYFEIVISKEQFVRRSAKYSYTVIPSIGVDTTDIDVGLNEYNVLTELIKDVNDAVNSVTIDTEVKMARNGEESLKTRLDNELVKIEYSEKNIKDSLDGEVDLNSRLERDLRLGREVNETKEGQYLTFENSVSSKINEIEFLGNTVQDENNLADIKSCGIDNGDGTFKMSILSVGENLFNEDAFESGALSESNGQLVSNSTMKTSDFIKVSIGNDYILNTNGYHLHLYDKSKKWIKRLGVNKFISDVDGYVRISVSNATNQIKLQEGTVATPYTPYQETRCDMKLPCQLEKWDRLYFDKGENVWCVDKKLHEKILKGSMISSTVWRDNVNTVGCLFNYSDEYFEPFINKATIYSDLIPSNSYERLYADDIEGISYYKDNTIGFVARVSKAKLAGRTTKQYFDEVVHKVKYLRNIPQKIVLPQSEQIKLNSFANKTHIYTISGDVDATVKATVSKSLSSTVQANTNEINILSDKIADIQGLKESQDFAYETDKGYLVCKDTQNGVVKDLKVYGKSLVNLLSNSKMKFTTSTTGWSNIVAEDNNMLQQGKTYTLIPRTNTNKTNINGYLCELNYEDGTRERVYDSTNLERCEFRLFTPKKNVTRIASSLRQSTESYSVEFECIVLEGDHTQNPPQYFEGIASVGNGNEIEVLSCNKNLVIECVKGFTIGGNEGSSLKKSESSTYNHIKAIAPKGEFYYKSKGTQYYVFFTDENLKILKIQKTGLTVLNNDVNASYIFTNIDNTLDYMDLTVSYDKYYTVNNIESKQDKKTILYKDIDNTWKPVTELRGIDENNCDVLDATKNKYVKKYLRYRVTGDETMGYVADYGTVSRFYIMNMFPKNNKLNAPPMCNILPLIAIGTPDVEGINSHSVSMNYISFQIKSSRLESKDVIGFKKWLKANNIEIVIELEVPQEYEINPIYPDSFEGDTMVLFNSGAIAPSASWKITCNLTSFLSNIDGRVSGLEDKIYMTNLANLAVALNVLNNK